jgi:ribosome-associated translation inhibitor RaiA
MTENHQNNHISKIKKQLWEVFPHAKKIEVKLRKTRYNVYESKVMVLTPKTKSLIAIKRDSYAQRALDKAYGAIIRQVHKIKTRWDRMKNKEVRALRVA